MHARRHAYMHGALDFSSVNGREENLKKSGWILKNDGIQNSGQRIGKSNALNTTMVKSLALWFSEFCFEVHAHGSDPIPVTMMTTINSRPMNTEYCATTVLAS